MKTTMFAVHRLDFSDSFNEISSFKRIKLDNVLKLKLNQIQSTVFRHTCFPVFNHTRFPRNRHKVGFGIIFLLFIYVHSLDFV